MNNKTIAASLSTMWAIKNYPNLNDFIQVARELGFEKIELNHQVDSGMLAKIDIDHVQFSSLHEPCPADVSTKVLVERDWLISSTDKASRRLGVESIKKSIKLAHEINAPIVVIHCGNVKADQGLERTLRKLFVKGDTQSDEYQDVKKQNIQTRAEAAEKRLSAVKESLGELIDYATNLEIKLGLENRYHFMDIPSIDEMEELLALDDSCCLGFIYDVGHAQALDRLGFYSHSDWLNRFSDRMLGAHLHDVIGLTDHLAPGLGEINFKQISAGLNSNAFRTFELQPGNTLAQVRKGIDVLIGAGCIRQL